MEAAGLCGKRLLACAGLVRPGRVAADIGTDHGYLACYLVESGICPRAYATDLREQPLARAQEQIRARGLEERIEARLTHGLRDLPLEEIEDVVIAGMGGELIADILADRPGAKDLRLHFVLQPMSRPEALRRALYGMGFAIREEHGVREGGFAYTVLSVHYTGREKQPDELFCWTGLLPDSGEPDSTAALAEAYRRLQTKAEGMCKSRRNREEAARWQALAEELATMIETRRGQD